MMMLCRVMEEELEGGDLFVCAVGLPPVWVVERMHARGIIVMNMIGSPKHVSLRPRSLCVFSRLLPSSPEASKKPLPAQVKGCLAAGVDIICAQGGEGGGHTGTVSTLVLVPQAVDLCKGTDTLVVGAGGIVNGRGIAALLALGADGAWMGSRFIVTPEANAPQELKEGKAQR